MKVLWFSNTPCGALKRNQITSFFGGWLMSLSDELRKVKEIELSIAYISYKNESDFIFEGIHYYPIVVDVSNKFKHLLYLHTRQAKKDDKILPLLISTVNSVQPDIIHIHGTEQCFNLIIGKVNVPIVISIQGLLAPYRNKYFAGIPLEKIKQNEGLLDHLLGATIANDLQSINYRIHNEEQALKNIKYVIGRTDWDSKITALYNPNRRYFVVNEILRPIFNENIWMPNNKFKNKIKLVTVTSNKVYKGFDTLLKTAHLLTSVSNFEFEWNVIGVNAKDNYVRLMEEHLSIKSSSCNLNLLGKLPADKLNSVLLKSDIFVQVSRIENSPNSLCEAMILGMPIVSTSAGGTNSLLEDGKEGLLVQEDEIYSLAANISYLINNEDIALKMGEMARQRALVRHNPDSIVKELLTCYHQIQADNGL